MRRFVAFVLVLIASALSAQEPKHKPPTVKECRAHLRVWLPSFSDAYGSPACNSDSLACPFAAGLRTLSTHELLDIPPQAEACIFADRHRKGYAWVATRAENVIVMRAGYFFRDADLVDDYIRWEDRQRGITPTPKDEPDTVAQR
jgi:hypothetical protein